MATKYRKESIRSFRGLSDRKIPVGLTNVENPSLMNVEFSERSMKRRNGFTPVHENRLFDTSVRFNGVDQYARIPHLSAYDWATTPSRVCVHARIIAGGTGSPNSKSPILTRGDAASSVYLWIEYDWATTSWAAYATGAAGTFSVSDTGAMGATRCIEFGPEEGTANYELRVYEEDGTLVGSSQQAFTGFAVGNTDDWLIGAGVRSSAITDFATALISEVRMFSGSGEAAGSALVGRELPYQIPASESLDNLIGYWRCNDGRGNVLEDISTTGNDAALALEGPAWVEDKSLVQGSSGLEFNGANGGVVWTMPSGSFGNDVFNVTGAYTANVHWTVSAQVVFRLDPQTGRIAAGQIIHAGTGATPTPFGLEVTDTGSVAQLSATYSTGPTTVTINMQNSWANRPLRVIVDFFGTAGPTFNFLLWLFEADGSAQLGTAAANPASIGGAGTGVWCIGAKTTTTSWPFTFSKTFRGVIDDVKIVRDVNNTSGSLTLNYSHTDPILYNETARSSNTGFFIAQQLRFNEGTGRALQSEGAYDGGTATIYPEEGTGLRWGYGLVEPEVPPPIRRVRDYRRFVEGGETRRTFLVGSGSTLYEIDVEAGTATIRAGGLPRSGKLTAAQYGDLVFIGGEGSQRPLVWDGADLRLVGIQGPADAPRLITAGSTGSGSFSDGTHHFYVTFRNRQTGAESLPGPPASFTFSGGTSTQEISSMVLPTSSDPQVDQRRLWATVKDAGAGSLAYLVGTIDDNVTGTIFDAANPLTDVDINEITLDYLDNEVPPSGSIVHVFQDRLFVTGGAQYPTRIYWSQPGQLTSFNQLFDYVDADLDEGDPVTGLVSLSGALGVMTNDGRLAMSPTGNAQAPFFLTRIAGGQGVVGSNAFEAIDGGVLAVGERDIYAWDGATSRSLSSPTGDDVPSIETLVRTGMNDELRGQISLARHRGRNQVWISYASNESDDRNDRVLVYDLSLGVWSVYSMPMETLMEVEGSSEQVLIYGGSWGRVYKLDDGDWDGPLTVVGGQATSGTTTSLTHTAQSWTTDAYRGLVVSWLDVANEEVRHARIRSNTATVLNFQEEADVAPAASDPYVIGGIPWYADWHLNWGSPFTLKKLRWAKLIGISDATNFVSLKFTADILDRDFVLGAEYAESWAASDTFKRILIGGLGRSFRVRVGDTGVPTVATADSIPSLTGRIDIHGLEIDAEEVEAL
jgi:hypothetical protein